MSSPAAESSSHAVKKDSRKPKYSRFTQQELPACKPLLTPTWVITIFFLIGIVFVPIGAVALLASRNVVEVVESYESTCINKTTNAQRDQEIRKPGPKTCFVTLQIAKKMKPPIYVYYQLDNFYQNHRRYVKSRSDPQLRGDPTSDLSTCKPEDYLNGNMSQPINPCGLIAWSFFNDTYAFSKAGGAPVPVDQTGIAWPSDKKDKFGSQLPKNFNTDNATRGGGTLNASAPINTNEHFIVWMRTAALPTFRKLWGKINETLEPGTTLNVTIQNRYNTYSFNGKKKLVLSTTSWLGGKNDFLGIAYLTIGCMCLFLALVFFLVHINIPRPLGDTTYLSWNRVKGSGVPMNGS